ncbi:hypothetical protein KEM55_007579 [Ascosphaera atra]|nr:hypothetical protein KEM55_007579 [Ascosphaera atra]
MQGACSEAVYLIGMERNSDVVKMSCYAPIIEHFEMAEWSPDLFGLDASPDSLTGSPSYYVQKMFANNFGEETVPVDSDSGFGPVYYVATKSDSKYFVNMANYGDDKQSVTLDVPKASTGTLELLSGDKLGVNKPHAVTIKPKTSDLKVSGGKVTIDLPPYAVAAISLK